MRAELDATGIPAEAVGLYVQEVGAATPLLAWNADKPMNPASTMKLLTTLAALEALGPAYTWRTEVYADGPLRGNVLEGNLVLKGSGDPKLDLEKLWLLVKTLRGRGLREIRGDLVADRSAFSLENNDPARFDNAPTRPYNVQPDALLVNYKSIDLQFVPQEDSATVRIVSLPELAQINIVNELTLGAGDCESWPERPMTSADQPQLVFTGVFPRGCGEKHKSFSLLTPDDYLEALFRQLWQEAGGTFTGRVREGRVPASRAPARHLGIAAPGGDHPRRQQVEQQRDGAPALPDPGTEPGCAAGDHGHGNSRGAGMAVTGGPGDAGAGPGERFRAVAQRTDQRTQHGPPAAARLG